MWKQTAVSEIKQKNNVRKDMGDLPKSMTGGKR